MGPNVESEGGEFLLIPVDDNLLQYAERSALEQIRTWANEEDAQRKASSSEKIINSRMFNMK